MEHVVTPTQATPISLTADQLAQDARWAEIIASFTDAGHDPLASLAQEKRVASEDPEHFLRECVKVFEQARRADALEEVFALAGAAGWSMLQPEIEVALDALKDGATAQQAFDIARKTPEAEIAIVAELEAAVAAEIAADERGEDNADLADARDGVALRLCHVQATTLRTAVAQIAVATNYCELVRGCSTQEDRDYMHDRAERLLKSALHLFGDELSPDMWSAFVGGPHPSEGEREDFDPDAWIAACEAATGGKVYRTLIDPVHPHEALIFSVADVPDGRVCLPEGLEPRERFRAVFSAAPLIAPDGEARSIQRIEADEQSAGRMMVTAAFLTASDRAAMRTAAPTLAIAAE